MITYLQNQIDTLKQSRGGTATATAAAISRFTALLFVFQLHRKAHVGSAVSLHDTTVEDADDDDAGAGQRELLLNFYETDPIVVKPVRAVGVHSEEEGNASCKPASNNAYKRISEFEKMMGL